MKYRPEVDGLRALAVMPVVLFHAGFESFEGGYVGVDVFFVISGYLITSILLNEISSNNFSISKFYERRARRILPALFTVLFFSTVCAYYILLPAQLREFGQELLAVVIFAPNLLYWLRTDYFDVSAEHNPLLHTWSLGVEEQFYVLLPLALLIIYRYARKQLFKILLSALFISFILSTSSMVTYPSANFFLLPHRAWELLAGSLLAVRLQKSVPPGSDILSGTGLIMIGLSVFMLTPDSMFPGLLAVPPVLGTYLIIQYGQNGTLVHRLLSLNLIVGLGVISYSLYLWHQPLFVFSRLLSTDELNSFDRILIIFAAISAAIISWKFIEQPTRRAEFFLLKSPKQLFSTSLLCVMVFTLIGYIFHTTRGIPERFTEYTIADYQIDNRILKSESWDGINTMIAASSKSKSDFYASYDWFERYEGLKVLIVGNSYSKDLWNILSGAASLQSKARFAQFDTQISTAPYLSELYQSPAYKYADIVIIASRYRSKRCRVLSIWACNDDFESIQPLVERFVADGKGAAIVGLPPEFPAVGLQTLTDELILSMSLDEISKFDPGELAAHINKFHSIYHNNNISLHEINSRLRHIARNLNVPYLSRVELACNGDINTCPAVSSTLSKYYFDFGHITIDGAKYLSRRVDETNWFSIFTESIE